MKLLKKKAARNLRIQGYSLREISEKLDVSKSTASLWTRDIVLASEAQDRLKNNSRLALEKANMSHRNKKALRLKDAEELADELLKELPSNLHTKLVALSVMYWCEGAKNDTRISFTNSDPDLVRAFIEILTTVFSVDRSKIKACVHLHDYHNEIQTHLFWSHALNISLSQFTKPFIKESAHLNKKQGYMGCVRISYYDAHIARIILSFAKKLIKLYI